jgi:hypothetical protein
VIVLLGKIPGRHYNYREILPGVIAAKSSAPHQGNQGRMLRGGLANFIGKTGTREVPNWPSILVGIGRMSIRALYHSETFLAIAKESQGTV